MKSVIAFAVLCIAGEFDLLNVNETLWLIMFIFQTVASAQNARPTPAKGDFRNEFDHLLVATSIEHFNQFEHHLIELNKQVEEVEKTKNKQLQAQIVSEIETGLRFVSGAHNVIEKELKRTDLDLLEQYNFEVTLAVAKVLVADFTALEKKVKAIH